MSKSRKDRLQEMLALEPNDPELRYALAMEEVSAGTDEEAVRCLRELIEVAPDYVPAYQQAGQALVRLARPEEARQLWTQGICAARQKGNTHAADEMQGMLDNL
jgi:Flp pilus assembly protein TadD